VALRLGHVVGNLAFGVRNNFEYLRARIVAIVTSLSLHGGVLATGHSCPRHRVDLPHVDHVCLLLAAYPRVRGSVIVEMFSHHRSLLGR
jgi:hypothetical protein